MKHKTILTYIALAFLAFTSLSSCTSYSRLIECDAVGGKTDGNKNIVFENDTVRVEYNLWGENGSMYFNIYNKLNVPLYVDWYKCAYIEGERKYDYTGLIKERKTFIPPRTKVSNPVQYYLLGDITPANASNNSNGKIKITSVELRKDPNATVTEVNKTWKKNGKVKVYSKNFSVDNSPFTFRSFITVSTCESADECTNGKNMLFINNSFYVKKISEMKQHQFLGKGTKVPTVVKKGNRTVRGRNITVYEYPYRSGNSFYISLVF